MKRYSIVLITLLIAVSSVFADIPPENKLKPVAPAGSITFQGLWNTTGPVVRDIKQVMVYNCYWDAVMLSVLLCNQNWIKNLFTFANGTSLGDLESSYTDSVVVKVWNPTTLEPHSFTALLADASNTENTPNSWWWGDALTQGLKQLAGTTTIDGINSTGDFLPYAGSATATLPVLTGMKTSYIPMSSYAGIDNFWTDLVRAPKTPIIVASLGVITPSIPPVQANHDYAIMSTMDYGNGTRIVTARNPWGATDVFHLEDLWTGSFALVHLDDWKTLVWPGS